MEPKILTAGLASLLLLGAPAVQAQGATQQNQPQVQASHVNGAQQVIHDSVNVVQQVQADHYFGSLLKRAKGVVILPNLAEGALGVGIKGGEGVLLAHNKNGSWSQPAFLSMGGISIGPQVGGKVGPVVMLLMTDKALYNFTEPNNFSLNANAGLTIVNYSTRGQGGFGKGDVIVYSIAGGAYVGASIGGADFAADRRTDAAYYGEPATTTKIIKGDVQKNPHAKPLINALPGA